MRWTMLLAALIPLLLGIAFLLSRASGNHELARMYFRSLRLVIGAELVLILVLALAGFLYEQRARKREAMQFHPPGQLVDLGGYKLHLYCTGSGGPTVILGHGHQATYLDWYLVQPELAGFARVCSFDRAGHGWSEPSPEPAVPGKTAEELRRLLDLAGEKPPYILVGHSFGGWDAIAFAHKFPGNVRGIVLVDSPHPDVLRRASSRSRLWLRLMQFSMPFGLPRLRGWCDGGPTQTLPIRRALTCRPEYMKTILREDAAFPAAAKDMRKMGNLGALPLTVISADRLSARSLEAGADHTRHERDLTELSTNSQFVVAAGSGHDIPLARPEVIVMAVKALIKPREQPDSRGTP